MLVRAVCILALAAPPVAAQGRVSSGGFGGGMRTGGGIRGGAPNVSRGGLPPMTIGRPTSVRGISSPAVPTLPPRPSQPIQRPRGDVKPPQTPERGIFPQPGYGHGGYSPAKGWGYKNRHGFRPPPGFGFHGNGWWINFPIYFPVYGAYSTPWVIQVDSTQTRSDANHVITVPGNRAPAERGESKVYEVRPKEGSDEPGAVETTPIGGSEEESDEPMVLVALKDGTIFATTDRWIDGEQVRFVGTDGRERSAAISDVDMSLSAQLNRERGVAFVLEVR